EADRRPGAIRPRHPRQENRESRALHENTAATVQAGRKIRRHHYPELRKAVEQSQKRHQAIEGISAITRFFAAALSEILFQAKGHRGVCPFGGRALPNSFSCSGRNDE